jgi:hypothetical protein
MSTFLANLTNEKCSWLILKNIFKEKDLTVKDLKYMVSKIDFSYIKEEGVWKRTLIKNLVNIDDLMKHPNFDIEWVKLFIDKDWDCEALKNHPNFDIEWFACCPDLKWDLQFISSHPDFDIELLEKFPDFEWDFSSIELSFDKIFEECSKKYLSTYKIQKWWKVTQMCNICFNKKEIFKCDNKCSINICESCIKEIKRTSYSNKCPQCRVGNLIIKKNPKYLNCLGGCINPAEGHHHIRCPNYTQNGSAPPLQVRAVRRIALPPLPPPIEVEENYNVEIEIPALWEDSDEEE